MKRVFYAGWMGYKNLGDDLLWELFNEKFAISFDKKDYQLIPRDINYPININECDIFVLGGGSLLNANFINLMHNGIKQNKEIILWGTGVDWIPKSYIQSLSSEKYEYINTEQIYSPEIQAKLVEVVDQAKYTGVRGPLTFEFIKQMGVEKNKFEICGDPGFILDPNSIVDKEKIKLNSYKPIIGVNWGTSFNYIYGEDEMLVEDQLVEAIKALIKSNYKIYIYLFWDRDKEACQRLFNKIGDSENVNFDTNLYNKYQMVSLMQNFTFTINFKLHANVLSHVAEIPFLPLGYRFKVFDYANSVKMEEFLISTDSTQIKQRIIELATKIYDERQDIIKNLNSYKSKYRKKVLESFEKGFV